MQGESTIGEMMSASTSRDRQTNLPKILELLNDMTESPGEEAPADPAAPERDNSLNRSGMLDISENRDPFSSTTGITKETEKHEMLQLTAEELINGSTVMNMEAALAIDAGKVAPVGYEKVAAFFRTEYGKTTPAHCVWLIAEARAAGTLDEMKKEFPDVERQANLIVTHMEQNHPHDLVLLSKRVNGDGYSFDDVRKMQQAAESVAKALFKTLS